VPVAKDAYATGKSVLRRCAYVAYSLLILRLRLLLMPFIVEENTHASRCSREARRGLSFAFSTLP